MFAIIETGGKQYKVAAGDLITVEKLAGEIGDTVTIDKIVLVSDGKKTAIGSPYVKDASVTAKIVQSGRGKKLTVFTYKPKKHVKRKLGHRQPFTKLEIVSID
jgi:ribosomal protein L21